MKNFHEEYKKAFEDMVHYHVRDKNQEQFLCKMYKSANKYASSTVWGAVGQILVEKFNYSIKDLQDLLTIK